MWAGALKAQMATGLILFQQFNKRWLYNLVAMQGASKQTFVGVDSFQVHDVADDVILVCDAVPPQHVSGLAGDV